MVASRHRLQHPPATIYGIIRINHILQSLAKAPKDNPLVIVTHLLVSLINAKSQLDHAVDPLGMHCRLLNTRKVETKDKSKA